MEVGLLTDQAGRPTSQEKVEEKKEKIERKDGREEKKKKDHCLFVHAS